MAVTMEDYRDRLLAKLAPQASAVRRFERYYEGDQPLPRADVKDAAKLRPFRRDAITNICEPVVNESVKRSQVIGVRTGDDTVDKLAWRILQASGFDSGQDKLWTASRAGGIAYLSVWKADGDEYADVAAEHGTQMAHIPEPGDFRKVHAGLKAFYDEMTGEWVVNVQAGAQVVEWRANADPSTPVQNVSGWRVTMDEDNPIGRPAIVPVPNDMNLRGQWFSELRNVVGPQRRINQTNFNLLVAGQAFAFPLLAVFGVEQKDQETPLVRDGGRTWVFASPDGKLIQMAEGRGEMAFHQLSTDFEQVSSISSTPLFALSSNLANPPSAEALAAMAAPADRKALRKQRQDGEAVEDAVRMALAFEGVDDAALTEMEVRWADPRLYTLAEIGDYVAKIGKFVPREVIWERIAESDQEVERIKGMALAEAFTNLVTQINDQQTVTEEPTEEAA